MRDLVFSVISCPDLAEGATGWRKKWPNLGFHVCVRLGSRI